MNTRVYVVGIIVLIAPFVYGAWGLVNAIHGLFGN